MLPLRELSILNFINKVTDKPNWTAKVLDEEILHKWKAETVGDPNVDMTESMFDWCIDELRWKAEQFKSSPAGAISIYNGDIVKSDIAVSQETKERLQKAVKVLEDVPEKQKDWHPGSNGQVLDLVHPSLFPFIFGRSKILDIGAKATTLEDCIRRCGEGEAVPPPTYQEVKTQPWEYRKPRNPWSDNFQWLGKKLRFTTYINNLHPARHTELYGVIEEVLTATIPLWERSLAPWATEFTQWPTRIPYENCEYDPDPENGPETDGPQQLPNEHADDYWQRRGQWYEDTRRVKLPEPGVFKDCDLPTTEKRRYLSLKELYGTQGIQVIVKLANIELTPNNPEYPGGSWHVEGKLNEHICATSIYYYSSQNITSSSLAFRQHISPDDPSEISNAQDHHDWLSEVFGLEQHGPCVQNVGAIETKEGRLVTFPNILQHQVQPFKLLDPTKPGHRKILAFFLVDPSTRIISTANVPCQRLDWWKDATISEGAGLTSGLFELPPELQHQVFEGVDGFPINPDDAMAIRLEFMEERKQYVISHTNDFMKDTISLCEH
ncbi:hypothetical protein FA15DRAFT_679397 [Coprinopsis marcescibilis]|uniref:Uncharacterized protein n=1 Tax=Coprinopsis marcescibilis TaxID=230819 RepID=A0A5C3L2I9_COPMA|nr:hypothetical protein FA15DRAFT_679397 [Coprinopsis marcescibilis]